MSNRASGGNGISWKSLPSKANQIRQSWVKWESRGLLTLLDTSIKCAQGWLTLNFSDIWVRKQPPSYILYSKIHSLHEFQNLVSSVKSTLLIVLFQSVLNFTILGLEKHVRESIINVLVFISPVFPVLWFYASFCYFIKCIALQ